MKILYIEKFDNKCLFNSGKRLKIIESFSKKNETTNQFNEFKQYYYDIFGVDINKLLVSQFEYGGFVYSRYKKADINIGLLFTSIS